MINESVKYDEKGVGSISNRDNADVKQLQWEMKRDRDMNGGFKKRKNNKIHFKKKNNGKVTKNGSTGGKNKNNFSKQKKKNLKK